MNLQRKLFFINIARFFFNLTRISTLKKKCTFFMVKPLKCPFQQKFEKSRGYFSLDKNEWHDSLSFDHLLDFKIFKRLSFGMFWHCGRKCDTLSKKLKIRFCGGGGSGQEGEHFFRFSFRSLKKDWFDEIQ